MAIKVENIFIYNKGTSKIKASGTINVDGIVISDIKVIEGKSGFFVGLPSRSYEKDGEQKWVDIVKFENEADREAVNLAVLNAFYSKRSELNIAPDGSKVTKKPATKAPAIQSDVDWFDESGNKKEGGWEQGW